jgi:hypothetical protein
MVCPLQIDLAVKLQPLATSRGRFANRILTSFLSILMPRRSHQLPVKTKPYVEEGGVAPPRLYLALLKVKVRVITCVLPSNGCGVIVGE